MQRTRIGRRIPQSPLQYLHPMCCRPRHRLPRPASTRWPEWATSSSECRANTSASGSSFSSSFSSTGGSFSSSSSASAAHGMHTACTRQAVRKRMTLQRYRRIWPSPWSLWFRAQMSLQTTKPQNLGEPARRQGQANKTHLWILRAMRRTRATWTRQQRHRSDPHQQQRQQRQQAGPRGVWAGPPLPLRACLRPRRRCPRRCRPLQPQPRPQPQRSCRLCRCPCPTPSSCWQQRKERLFHPPATQVVSEAWYGAG
jgi:hypothetical protein